MSVGGCRPGDVLLKDAGATAEQIETHPHPFYTPIATFGANDMLEPVGYGLKFAGSLCGGTFLKADLTSTLQVAGVDATAYAAKLAGGKTSIIILNKDAEKDLALILDFGSGQTGAVHAETLHAQALESREAHINAPAALGHLRSGKYSVVVGRASGIRLTVG
jgi:hypothetical protein